MPPLTPPLQFVAQSIARSVKEFEFGDFLILPLRGALPLVGAADLRGRLRHPAISASITLTIITFSTMRTTTLTYFL
jgi:hypothetical protein